MTLLHTALLSEAQIFIEKYKLSKVNSSPKVYTNENIIVVISGIGKENTYNALQYIFDNYTISKAINIGVSGCSDITMNIGELFCTNRELQDINTIGCKTVDTPQLPDSSVKENSLYDMEASYFLEIVKQYLDEKDIYIFKIVSDHLDSTIPKKDFIKKLIFNNFNKISKYV